MKPGTVIASRFEIVSRARKGGEGQIFFGRDRDSGGPVAIKLLHEEAFKSERFEREVGLLTNLVHPGIVRYIAHGIMGRRGFLVMEWVEGRTLSQLLRRGLTLRESVAVTWRIAEALGALHARGVVHRDIKPSNIMFLDDTLDRVKLLDFGIARPVGPSTMTRTGVVIGTPGFMSPEQARGDWDVDARADVFSLGCVLYTCLCGQPPFTASRMLANLAAILFLDPVPVDDQCPEAPERLRALVGRMLAKAPAQRPADAAEVAQELAALDALPHGPRRAVPRGEQRRPSTSELPVDEDTATTQTYTPSARRRQIHENASLFILAAVDEERSAAAERARAVADDWAARIGKLRQVVADHGGMSSLLADGTFVAVFSSGGDAWAEEVGRAARCALSLRAVIPRAPMVIGTGGGLPDVTSLERLVDTLVEESLRRLVLGAHNRMATDLIRIGEGLASTLAEEFSVRRDDAAHYLVPRSA